MTASALPFRRPRSVTLSLAVLALAGMFMGGAVDEATAQAKVLQGSVTVIDGDTLKMGRQHIRLFGIDAPENQQSCQTAQGHDWWCGSEASKAVRSMVSGQIVTCHQQDIDRYNRVVAICEVSGRDLGGELVEQGLAIAYRYFSRKYVPAEDRAKRARRGMWSGTFVEPYAWRKAQRR